MVFCYKTINIFERIQVMLRSIQGHPDLRGGLFYGLQQEWIMTVKLIVLIGYALGILVVTWWARARWSARAETYFLADRALGPLIFLATMAATNFSAFTVFGASGAGYLHGYAFYPIVGFGTGFMALTFWLIGKRARELGREYGALTPPDLVRHTYGSQAVSLLFALVMIVFTIPYLALQPIAAGYALKELLGWNHLTGATLVTVIICLYTFRGGLKAVALTDAFQGLLMYVVLLIALFLVAAKSGGLTQAGQKLLTSNPELFSRPGAAGRYLPAVWFSYIFLWFFCDPMFPQLFQRFLAARGTSTIRRTMLAYPFVCSAVFLLPVTIGVLGRLSHPGLEGKAADSILPLLAADMNSPVMGALVIACGLAALMSTMDSQLLTLSSIFSQDILPIFRKDKVQSAWPGRVFVVVLAGAGLALAANPPGTILDIAALAFTGLAVLFPTVLFGLYPGLTSKTAAVLSIIAGQAALVLDALGYLPKGNFLAVVPIMALTFAVYMAVAVTEKGIRIPETAWLRRFWLSPYTWGFLALFALAHDVWRWGSTPNLWWGWPSWIFYFLLLSLIQTGLMARWTRAYSTD
jgi:SSS family solute:Na+ symporter